MARRYNEVNMSSPEVVVDQRHLVHNVEQLRKLSGQAAVFPVIKANAYGHGLVPVAKILESSFAENIVPLLCVARLSEAKRLRDSGVRRRLLILSQYEFEDLDQSILSDVDFVVSSSADFDVFEKLSDAKLKQIGGIHLNFNTGMNRLGFRVKESELFSESEDLSGIVLRCGRLRQRGLSVSGLMTHLACSEETPEKLSRSQITAFGKIVAALKTQWAGVFPEWIHVANSGGVVHQVSDSKFVNAIRPGLHLYGVYHALAEKRAFDAKLGLKPVMQLRAPLRQVFWIKQGEGVGYGHFFRCRRDTLVGTVTLGYADGVSRHLSRADLGRARCGFFIEGHFAPIIGRVSMDMTMVDLTDHPLATTGQIVPRGLWAFFIDAQQGSELIADELGTIPYEVLCSIGERIPRLERSAPETSV